MQRRFVQPYCIFFRRTSSETAVSAHGDQTGTVREFPLSGTLYDFFSPLQLSQAECTNSTYILGSFDAEAR